MGKLYYFPTLEQPDIPVEINESMLFGNSNLYKGKIMTKEQLEDLEHQFFGAKAKSDNHLKTLRTKGLLKDFKDFKTLSDLDNVEQGDAVYEKSILQVVEVSTMIETLRFTDPTRAMNLTKLLNNLMEQIDNYEEALKEYERS